jgi:ABC-type transporter Mla subunit MlaD
MTEATNHWKLGLFVVVSTALLVFALVLFGTRIHHESVRYVSFFDEAVTGLEIGSPVRYRGVNIGKVANIDVAPDRRHVEIGYDLEVSVLGRLGLSAGTGQSTKLKVPPDLRAQLGSSGMTGVKYVLIDFFDIKQDPPPVLPFKVPQNYIPAAASTLKNLEDSVTRAVEEFPRLAQNTEQTLAEVKRLLDSVEAQHIPEHAISTLDNLDATLAAVRKQLGDVDAKHLSSDARNALATLNATLLRAQGAMERVDGERGVLASMQRASDSIGDVAGSARGYGPEVADTMRALRDAADSFKELVDTLQLDSDMLVKGRAKVKP